MSKGAPVPSCFETTTTGTQKVITLSMPYWDHNVAETRDANVTWTTLTTTFGPPDLARDPVWEDRLFAANNNGDTNHGGVIFSEDGGSTWTEYMLGWTGSIAVVSK